MLMGLSKKHYIPYKHRHIAYKIYFYIIFVATIIGLFIMAGRLRNAFLNVFTPYAINVGSDAINYTVADYFSKNQYDYSDISRLSYNQNNEITSVQANTSLMNKIKADLSIYLQEEIIDCKATKLYIPFGTMFNNIALHGIGPDIPITVKATDITDLVFNDSFESVGINQVRHKIFIEAYVTISVHCANMTHSEVIHDIIPVAETVIVGDVPMYYSENGSIDLLPNNKED